MSYLATRRNSDSVKTASEIRDEYLSNGIKDTEWFCPFCGIELTAKAIYGKKGQYVKSPHFSSKNESHIRPCTGDGFDLEENTSVKVNNDKKGIYGKISEVPEKLRIDKFVKNKIVPIENVKEFTTEIIKGRIDKLSFDKKYVSKYSSRFIRSFIEAKKYILSEIYKILKENQINSNDEINKEFKKLLSSYPLSLPENETNYYNGFRTTKFYSKKNIIWEGIGIIDIVDGKYVLLNDSQIKNGEKFYDLNLYVDISTEILDKHKNLKILRNAYEKKEKRIWYALGKIQIDDEILKASLCINNIDFLYIPE
ncbi:MAG: hypothetical protein JXM74_10370 [Fusobacteriaceae bacterium]|nr:hypothetical protein [Fusobacteriaceae bacterium]MBN2839146.1 hypothetical protein [Fusobacteriaceae bacterium]